MIRRAKIHFTHRVGWLRDPVLGANDGIVSTASSKDVVGSLFGTQR